MYSRRELKEFKEDLKNIELEFCQEFGVSKIESCITNRYKIPTKFGIYEFYFDEDSIFGRFPDIKNYSDDIPDKYEFDNKGNTWERKHNINPYSGKFNFHYNEIYDFIDEISMILVE